MSARCQETGVGSGCTSVSVVNGRAPPKVLIQRPKNSFYSADMSHSPRGQCLTGTGLLRRLPSAYVTASRAQRAEQERAEL